jgi:dolichyl-phosphate-mannose-protein mannosyltransferase
MLLVGLGIAIVALLPRVVGNDRGFMIDERLWIDRSAHFTDEVLGGHFSQAFTSGHPGVTTSWIAGLAQRTLPDDATLLERYQRARLAMSLASVALIVVIWLLARPLIGEPAAALGALFLSLDPFLLSLTKVVHLDGSQTLAMLASALALLRAVRSDEWRFMVLSGAFAGFGFLTRSFAAFMLVVVVVVLWRDGRGILFPLVPFLLGAGVVIVALWPLVWVRPWKAVSLVATGLVRGASDDSDAGRFFLGAHIPAPGPIFYPVAFALRASILGLAGGAATAAWAFRKRKIDEDARTAGWLLLYSLGFVALVSLTLKTADRYLLPAIAAIDLTIAIGLARVLRRRTTKGAGFILIAALTLHAVPALALHPNEFAHYDWLAGGPVVARHAIPVGRGEGLDEAALALARLPRAEELTVATTRLTGFEEFFPGKTIRIEDSSLVSPGKPTADLVLFYVSSLQVGRLPDVWARYRDRKPFYELRINTIPYVRVYRV